MDFLRSMVQKNFLMYSISQLVKNLSRHLTARLHIRTAIDALSYLMVSRLLSFLYKSCSLAVNGIYLKEKYQVLGYLKGGGFGDVFHA